ncbi:hypothetical protein SAMN05216281_111114 [Cryobacterium luteum]|nr:hypothetical protein SAMN05216281_111114 [Cryobacterium luteum]
MCHRSPPPRSPLRTSKTNRLNPLDEGHRAASASDEEWSAQLAARRRDLIGALAETVLDRPLSPLEHTAIDLALADAVRSAEVPILPMVVSATRSDARLFDLRVFKRMLATA